ncbi:hypothetical protein BJY00DRAFT_318558 [Aspergillus carlsbadensis]|nr:hypothetical protein BJY00DRAFT_318558 [Aspergillus carlsbadensis]
MPSVTSIFGQTITNWGPLPTAYTLPASCASFPSTSWALAFYRRPEVPLWHNCAIETKLCLPTPTDPSALEDLIEANAIPGDGHLGVYYSPGASCPAEWKTVGVAVRGERTVKRSGFLATSTMATVDEEWVRPMFYNNEEALVHLLDVGGTAVWCCPESMTTFLEDGACYSTLPSFTPSTACRTSFPRGDVATYTTGFPGDDGQTTEGELYVITATTTGVVETTTFSRSEATDWIAYSKQPAIRFVHGSSSGSMDTGEGRDDVDSGSGEDDSVQTNKSNAASIFSAGQDGPWGGGLGALLVFIVFGAGVVLVR